MSTSHRNRAGVPVRGRGRHREADKETTICKEVGFQDMLGCQSKTTGGTCSVVGYARKLGSKICLDARTKLQYARKLGSKICLDARTKLQAAHAVCGWICKEVVFFTGLWCMFLGRSL